MKWIKTLWPFVVVVLAVWIWNYPVYALTGRIESATDGKLKVLSSAGSVWNGHMQLGLSDGAKVYAIPEPLQWRLRWLEGENWLAVVVEHPKLVSPVHLGFNAAGINVQGGQLRMPASWLGATGAPFNTIRPEGVLQLGWSAWADGQSLQLVMKWLDAQSALASIRPLGEYVITITGNPAERLEMALVTNKGPLMLEGQGQWVNGERFVFNGTAYAQERSKPALTGLLSQMGRLEGDKYRLGVF